MMKTKKRKKRVGKREENIMHATGTERGGEKRKERRIEAKKMGKTNRWHEQGGRKG